MAMTRPLEEMDRRELLEYIETLEAKTATLEDSMEDLKAQLGVLDMDMSEFQVPDTPVPELRVSEQTADLLSEAAELFGGESLFDDDIVVEPTPVENGVVRLEPVTAEETYIPVGTPKKKPAPKTVKVKVKRK